MGLDMYLYAEKYIGGGWEHAEPAEKKAFGSVLKAIGFAPHKARESLTVRVMVGYWRKANAIHKWFVDNCQDGRDECQVAHVSREQLAGLRDACNKVLQNSQTEDGNIHTGTLFEKGKKSELYEKGQIISDPSVAIETLPTTGGFFFGKTDYDEFYLNDLRDTVKIIDTALSLEGYSYSYQSSW